MLDHVEALAHTEHTIRGVCPFGLERPVDVWKVILFKTGFDWKLILGFGLSGLFAGFFGVGGAVRGAFLAAFNLPKEIYIFTSGLIALFIDITRVSRYAWGGNTVPYMLFMFVGS